MDTSLEIAEIADHSAMNRKPKLKTMFYTLI